LDISVKSVLFLQPPTTRFFFFSLNFVLYQKFGEFCLPQILPNKSNLHLQRKKNKF
jgi:hypothetical protein